MLTKSLPNNSNLTSIKNDNNNTLLYYANIYFNIIVSGSSKATEIARKNDLSKFISFFIEYTGKDFIDNWTPSVTKHFLIFLQEKNYKPATINRALDSLRHFSKWLLKYRPLLAGSPFESVRNITQDSPLWNGLSSKQVMRLKMACEQRLNSCIRKNQDPLLEITIFSVLLATGLREAELVSLNLSHYHSRGFHHVKRKGNIFTKKVPIPDEPKKYLDQYILSQGITQPNQAIFSKNGVRLSTRAIRYICQRISAHASLTLPDEEKFHLSPHMLRHTFLKRIADKHGIHIAQKMSGNASISQIFRYTKPSQDEIDNIAHNLNI
jgi:integrase/recombinase XerD